MIVLFGEIFLIEAQAFKQRRVEASFDCAYRHPFLVSGLISAIPGTAAVGGVFPADTPKVTRTMAPVNRGSKRRYAIENGGIDNLSFA